MLLLRTGFVASTGQAQQDGASLPDAEISGVDAAEVVRLRNDAAVVDALEIEVDELVQLAAVEQPQHLRDRQRRSDGADERSADRLTREEGDTAPVECAVSEEALIALSCS